MGRTKAWEIRQERNARCQGTKGFLKGLGFILMALESFWWVLSRGVAWFIHFTFFKYRSGYRMKDGLDRARLYAESFELESVIVSRWEKIVASTKAVAIGIEKSEWDEKISKKMSQAELVIGLSNGMCNMMFILLFIWYKNDFRFSTIFLLTRS